MTYQEILLLLEMNSSRSLDDKYDREVVAKHLARYLRNKQRRLKRRVK